MVFKEIIRYVRHGRGLTGLVERIHFWKTVSSL